MCIQFYIAPVAVFPAPSPRATVIPLFMSSTVVGRIVPHSGRLLRANTAEKFSRKIIIRAL